MSVMTDRSPAPVEPEEQARADLYALLSRLFAAPVDAEMLRAIASIPAVPNQSVGAAGSAFVASWANLVAAAAKAQEAAIADEYQGLFVGSGRAEISLYIGAYTARSGVDTPLVALRAFLASQGLQRQTGVHEPEDHVAMLFEVMRHLIAEARSSVAQQQSFFDAFVWRGGPLLCDAIIAHPGAQFYRPVANFTRSFLFIEHDAFGM